MDNFAVGGFDVKLRVESYLTFLEKGIEKAKKLLGKKDWYTIEKAGRFTYEFKENRKTYLFDEVYISERAMETVVQFIRYHVVVREFFL